MPPHAVDVGLREVIALGNIFRQLFSTSSLGSWVPALRVSFLVFLKKFRLLPSPSHVTGVIPRFGIWVHRVVILQAQLDRRIHLLAHHWIAGAIYLAEKGIDPPES